MNNTPLQWIYSQSYCRWDVGRFQYVWHKHTVVLTGGGGFCWYRSRRWNLSTVLTNRRHKRAVSSPINRKQLACSCGGEPTGCVRTGKDVSAGVAVSAQTHTQSRAAQVPLLVLTWGQTRAVRGKLTAGLRQRGWRRASLRRDWRRRHNAPLFFSKTWLGSAGPVPVQYHTGGKAIKVNEKAAIVPKRGSVPPAPPPPPPPPPQGRTDRRRTQLNTGLLEDRRSNRKQSETGWWRGGS